MIQILSGTISSGSVILVEIAIIIVFGLLLGQLAEYLNIPDVTGYLVAGLILGPVANLFGLEILNESNFDSYNLLSNIALGFIAFQVGNELWIGKLKKTGIKIIIITLFQAILTVIFVVALLLIFNQPLPLALTLGAISAATAPAPIMMIVKKYKTKGELTNSILPVVGLGGAVAVMILTIFLPISVSLLNSEGSLEISKIISSPLNEIGDSILIGVILGIITGFSLQIISKDFEREQKNLDLVIVTIFLSTGLSIYFNASPILTAMVAGTVTTNMINKKVYRLEENTINKFIPPLMILFFTVAGAEISFDVIYDAGIIALIYIIGRFLGKFSGSFIGCKITKSSKVVEKYLWISLLPQSGVAIGLASAAYISLVNVAPDTALIIKNVTLGSVLLFELFGPYLVRKNLIQTGEVRARRLLKKKDWY